MTTSGGRNKTKACFNLESLLGKEISSDTLWTNTLCHNCADRNETLVRKLKEVRESFESSRKSIAGLKGGVISIKRQASTATSGKEKLQKRALFASDDPGDSDAARKCEEAATQVCFEDFYEEECMLTEVSLN